MNYCRIFTELGESFLEKIVSSSFVNNENHFALKVLDLVLICVGHHDYEVGIFLRILGLSFVISV